MPLPDRYGPNATEPPVSGNPISFDALQTLDPKTLEMLRQILIRNMTTRGPLTPMPGILQSPMPALNGVRG